VCYTTVYSGISECYRGISSLTLTYTTLDSSITYICSIKLLADIREDVRSLRDWVCAMEKSLASLQISTSWSRDKLREKLMEHQV